MPDLSNKLPPLNALRAFEVTARRLNFRLAAEDMFLTQGAVAQQVRHLEETLGVKLFNRLPRGLSLTEIGATYYVEIQKSLEIIALATEKLQKKSSEITISTTPSLASKWLIPHLANFQRAFPHLDLKIVATEKVSSFTQGDADLAIRLTKPPFDKSISASLLFPMDVYMVCSPQHQQAHFHSLQDLANQVFLHDAHDLWSPFIQSLALPIAIDTSKGLRFNQTALAIDAAITGQGIALASDPLVTNDISQGRLVKPFDIHLQQALGYYLVFPKEDAEKPHLKAIANWIMAEAKQHPF